MSKSRSEAASRLVAAGAALVIGLALGACEGSACVRQSDCTSGFSCRLGRCVPPEVEAGAQDGSVDAGAMHDAADGGSVDAGAMHDAGDAGAHDAGAHDAGRDASSDAASDAGRDAGADDAA